MLIEHALTLKLSFIRSLIVIISYYLLLFVTLHAILHKVHLL